jgi:RNA polymerase subunit RPABC4/transcription elongation factor Spt4
MLIKCSECNSEISEKAKVCPKCGNPLITVKSQTDAVKNVIKTKKATIIKVAVVLIIISVVAYFPIQSMRGNAFKEQLIGTWTYSNTVTSGNSAAVYSMGFRFNKDGTYIFVHVASASIGGGAWSDSPNNSQRETGTWSVFGNTVNLKKDEGSKSVTGSGSFKLTEITSSQFKNDRGFIYKKSR